MIETPLRYEIGARDPAAEDALIEALGIPRLLAAALVARECGDCEEARLFLEPALDSLGDPELLPDFDKAATILLAAREAGDLVFVHGDYDADGVTSAAILDRFLRGQGWVVHTHVPHRVNEGYGVHASAVGMARELGAKVFLTCDCGVAAFASLRLARDHGMKVVVTDHHEPGTELPLVEALVNPHIPSDYPFEELCGAGVVFRFCEGLAKRLGMPVAAYRRRFLEFAAIGTVADMMPLVGENRTIVYHGLKVLSETRTPGLVRLKEKAGAKPEVTARDIGFGLGPRLNAVGRVFDSALALKLLITRDEDEATSLAAELERYNDERKRLQTEAQERAMTIVEDQGLAERAVIMVPMQDLSKGIAGLVASKILERYGRPTFVLRHDPETGMLGGSARSIPGIDIFRIMEANRHLGVGGGGHAGAAGIHFAYANLDAVYAAFEIAALSQLSEGEFVPTVCADFETDLSDIDLRALGALSWLEPCGRGNEGLTLLARSLVVVSSKPTRNPSTARLSFRAASGKVFGGIQHGRDPNEPLPIPGERVDLLFKPEINEWNGDVSVQLCVQSVLPPTDGSQ